MTLCNLEWSVIMAKRNRSTTEKRQEKWINEGRGIGIGKDYKPWLTVQDVPSTGRATRLRGNKIHRQHHLLSDMERDYFYIVEYADSVKDIREQYPLLPLEQTLEIADELGIKHPTDPKTQVPVVMSTDFLLTVETDENNVLLARTIKSKADLMNERQVEKFEIEKRYWAKKEVNWGIVTENEIHETSLAKNIPIFHSYYDLSDLNLDNMSITQKEQLIQTFKSMIHGQHVAVRELATKFDEQLMLPVGTGISIFKHLVITKQIKIDLFSKFDIDRHHMIELVTDIHKWGEDAV